jgi:hypothetical protein
MLSVNDCECFGIAVGDRRPDATLAESDAVSRVSTRRAGSPSLTLRWLFDDLLNRKDLNCCVMADAAGLRARCAASDRSERLVMRAGGGPREVSMPWLEKEAGERRGCCCCS